METKKISTPKDIGEFVIGQPIELECFVLCGGERTILKHLGSYEGWDKQRKILSVRNNGKIEKYGFNPEENAFDFHYRLFS
ncbi:MAG: hypothetical protein AABX88_01600 [Nanoarchaeota archaeon]